MALINCKECQHEISDSADSCPNCGAPNKSSKNSFFSKKIVIVPIILLTVTGGVVYGIQKELIPTPKNQAKQAVRALLIDPESAKFDEIYKAGDSFCGTVNSKNRMGAYSGKSLFIKDSDTRILADLPEDQDFKNVYGKYGNSEISEIHGKCQFVKDWNESCKVPELTFHEDCELVLGGVENIKTLVNKYYR